jgi:hypothetical protein
MEAQEKIKMIKVAVTKIQHVTLETETETQACEPERLPNLQ